jgi:6-phosphogluconolactonase/glucosamine-6-phosphate isomerase/deaminase
MQFYKTSSSGPAINYLAEQLRQHISKGEKVLWLATGGSAIEVAVQAGGKLKEVNLANLSVTLADERFVPEGSKDSNWQQLLNAGFNLPGAQLLSVLRGEDINKTTEYYGQTIRSALEDAQYKIGLFGMGPDGHIAALFPHFPQINEHKLYAVSLNNSPKPPPLRMTLTVPAIERLDEAVIYCKGIEKKEALENLGKDLSITEQPAQILKMLPKLTIFNDQIGEEAEL